MDPDPASNTILWESIGIAVCLVFSAVFSASETALTALNASKARQLVEEEGHTSLKLWLDHPIPTLTAILIGNNIINVLASALATDLTNQLLLGTTYSSYAIPTAVGLMTLFLLTFGEITPKAIAKRKSVKVSLLTIGVIKVVYYTLYPVIWLFVRFTKSIMRALGNDPEDPAPFVTYEEIEYLIELGSREGTLTEDRERLLKSVVEFPDTLIREAMIPRTDTIAVDADIPFQDLLELLINCGHSRLPVYEGSIDNILGVFYAKDIIQIMALKVPKEDFVLRNHVRDVHFVPESKRISEQLSEFQRQRIHIAIVVDEFGGTAGIITLEDIIEEFFGEIRDEYDTEADSFQKVNDDTIIADARTPIYDIEKYYNVTFPEHPDYETIGGLLMATAGSVPQVDEHFLIQGLDFVVTDADVKRVGTVRITKTAETSTEDDDEKK